MGRSFVTAFAIVVCSLALVGCGTGQLPVNGKVLVGTEPLTTGNVAYFPVGADGSNEKVVARGEIGADGSYTLYTDGKKGALPGSYKVVVVANPPIDSANAYAKSAPLLDKKFSALATTPLTVDVASGGSAEKYTLTVTK